MNTLLKNAVAKAFVQLKNGQNLLKQQIVLFENKILLNLKKTILLQVIYEQTKNTVLVLQIRNLVIMENVYLNYLRVIHVQMSMIPLVIDGVL